MRALSVVIVNWRAMARLPACLAAVAENVEGIDAEVIVVDNASGDGAPAWVREHHPGAVVLENEENVGFARAVNRAIRESRGESLLLLNPDTLLEKDAVRGLFAVFARHPKTGLVGPWIRYPDGRFAPQSMREVPGVEDAFLHLFGFRALRRLFGRGGYTLDRLDPEVEHEVGALSGSCMLIRRAVIEEIGLLDEAFFLYGEDLDLCLRARRAGWGIEYTPRAVVLHEHGVSSRQRRLASTIDFYRAMRIFYRKHYAPSRHPLVNGVVSVGIGLRMLVALAIMPLTPGRRAG